ncbi:MAG: hypothetical protein ACRCXT_01150 [Paraclostridium sp.]
MKNNIKIKADFWSIFGFLTAIRICIMAIGMNTPVMFIASFGITNLYILTLLSVTCAMIMYSALVFLIYKLINNISIKYEINEEE